MTIIASKRAAQTYVPLKVLWTWWQAYQKQREEGLTPTDWTFWTALPAKTQDVITERLTLLGKVVTARAFPDECDLDAYIPELANQNQWSLRTAERWVRRYQVGGWWGLAPQHDPAKAGREQKESVVPALGTLTDSELETTFHRRSLLGDLANKTRVSRAEVEAQARAVGIGRSTLWLYLKQYRAAGISGLALKERSDKHEHHRITDHMKEIIRGVRFSQVDKPVRSVYKAVCQKAEALGEPAPSEWQVRKICAEIIHADSRASCVAPSSFRKTLPFLFGAAGVVLKDERVTFVWSSQSSILFRHGSSAKMLALVQIPHCSGANPYSLYCKADVAPMQIQNSHSPLFVDSSEATGNRRSPCRSSCHTCPKAPSGATMEVEHRAGLYTRRRWPPPPIMLYRVQRSRAA